MMGPGLKLLFTIVYRGQRQELGRRKEEGSTFSGGERLSDLPQEFAAEIVQKTATYVTDCNYRIQNACRDLHSLYII
jgi:hypothetical protein